MKTLTIEWFEGFYGFGAGLNVYLEGEKIAAHLFGQGKTYLLSKMAGKWRGPCDSKGHYGLRDDAPQVLVNALLYRKARPKLPMGQRIKRCHDTVTLDDRWVIRIINREEKFAPYGYWDMGLEITKFSTLEVIDIHTKKRVKEEIRINPNRGGNIQNHERHGSYGTVVKYVWPVKGGVVSFETDRRTVHIDLS